MKLGKLPDKDPIDRKPLGLRQSTWGKLGRYQKMYQEQYGKEIKLGELVEQMIETFMASDKDFQKRLKENGAGDAAQV